MDYLPQPHFSTIPLKPVPLTRAVPHHTTTSIHTRATHYKHNNHILSYGMKPSPETCSLDACRIVAWEFPEKVSRACKRVYYLFNSAIFSAWEYYKSLMNQALASVFPPIILLFYKFIYIHPFLIFYFFSFLSVRTVRILFFVFSFVRFLRYTKKQRILE